MSILFPEEKRRKGELMSEANAWIFTIVLVGLVIPALLLIGIASFFLVIFFYFF